MERDLRRQDRDNKRLEKLREQGFTGSIQDIEKQIEADLTKLPPPPIVGELDTKNIQALRDDIDSRGDLERFKLPKKEIFRRAGETDLQFQNRTAVKVEVELPKSTPPPAPTPAPTPDKKNFIERFKDSQKGFSLFNAISGTEALSLTTNVPSFQGPSLTGTLEFLGEESKALIDNQPLAISDIPPERLSGSISPNKNLFGLLSSEEQKSIIEIKTDATKEAIAQTVRSSPFIVSGVLTGGGSVGAALLGKGIASTTLFVGGSEKLFTPVGQERIKTVFADPGASNLRKFASIAVPVAEVALGAFGGSQVFRERQLLKLQQTKPEIILSQPIKDTSTGEITINQISQSKIPTPGFKFNVQPFVDTASGKQGLIDQFAPTLTTISKATLTSTTSTGGFNFVGTTVSSANILGVSGNQIILRSGTSPIAGVINPSTGRVVTPGKITVKTEIPQTFIGETTTRGETRFFGGLQAGKTDSGTILTVSGPINKVRFFPDVITSKGVVSQTGVTKAIADPKTLGLIAKQKQVTSFFVPLSDKGGQLTALQTIPAPSVTDTFTFGGGGSNLGLQTEIIGRETLAAGVSSLDIISRIPLGSPSIFQSPGLELESPTNYFLQVLIWIQILKQIQK